MRFYQPDTRRHIVQPNALKKRLFLFCRAGGSIFDFLFKLVFSQIVSVVFLLVFTQDDGKSSDRLAAPQAPSCDLEILRLSHTPATH
jgi:hypothetical protein